MSDNRKTNRRQDISELFGTEDIPLDDEYFEEKIKEMGDSPKPSAVRKMKLKKPEENAASLADNAGSAVGGTRSDRRQQELFGSGTETLSEEFFEEKIKELEDKQPVKKEPQSEYDKWIEESLKTDKGYGTKESYQGEVAEEKNSYAGSTYESYDRQQEEITAMIRRLKARDASNEARDQNIHNALYFSTLTKNHGNYSGDSVKLFDMIKSGAWYVLSSLAVMGLFYMMGVRGSDLFIPWGLGGVIGAVIRYNGMENYTVSEAIQQGVVEVGILIGLALTWILSLIFGAGLVVAIIISGICANIAQFVKYKVFYQRSTSESIQNTIPFFGLTIGGAVATVIVMLVFSLI